MNLVIKDSECSVPAAENPPLYATFSQSIYIQIFKSNISVIQQDTQYLMINFIHNI